MHYGFINFIINHRNETTKPTKNNYVTNLEELYNTLSTQNFPFSVGDLTIETVSVCSNNTGCTPNDTKTGKFKEQLVVMKNKHGELRPNRRPTFKTKVIYEMKPKKNGRLVKKKVGTEQINITKDPWVMMVLTGTLSIHGVLETIIIRVQKTGVIGVRLGLAQQEIFKPKRTTNQEIKKLIDYITEILLNIFAPHVPNRNQTKIATLTSVTYNIVTKSADYPPHKFKDHHKLMRGLAAQLPEYEFDPEGKSQYKQLPVERLKPIYRLIGQRPTLGISTFGMVSIEGAKEPSEIRNTITLIQSVYDQLRTRVEFDTTSKPPQSRRGEKAGGKIKKAISPKSIKLSASRKKQQLSKLLLADLRGIARNRKIQGYDKLKKANLLKVLLNKKNSSSS